MPVPNHVRRSDPPGVPARRAALRLLDAVLRRGQALEAALDSAAAQLTRADDRALAHALAAHALRRLADLDALIDSATRQTLPDDAKARMALRLALVQTLVLGTPPHAAIATVLPLVDGGPRKLVHGVFGTLARQAAALPPVAQLPATVAERWTAAWGTEVVAAAGALIATPPPLDLSFADPAAATAWAAANDGVSLAPGHVRVATGARVIDLPGYAEGAWWVQDIAATLPARLLGTGAGEALDLCAAPGGKTLQLAAAGWATTAVDRSESRLARLSTNLDRTGLAATVFARDALTWDPPQRYDAILLDAPCSATGIYRRHPDVLFRAHPALIAEMAELQAKLLDRAAPWVKPGGRLVYAVCSLEPTEGEAQLDAFLARRPGFAIDPVAPRELPAEIAPDSFGRVRVLPGALADAGGCDGFFIARLVRQR
ncbi:MAG: RsmB/NOP family class I SAM-dependent RNA methyltransferase [Pseudomonadota bacterium]